MEEELPRVEEDMSKFLLFYISLTNSFSDYTAGLSEEEQIRRAMEESIRQRNPHNYGWR